MILKVTLPHTVKNEIITHLKSNTTQEIGGVLVGTIKSLEDQAELNITGCIKANYNDNFVNEFHYNHQVWRSIYETKNQQFADTEILGWYHSKHKSELKPTETDYAIHSLFFNEPSQVLYLIDPTQFDKACFFQWEKDYLVPIDLETPASQTNQSHLSAELQTMMTNVNQLQNSISSTLIKQKQYLDEELTRTQKLLSLPIGMKLMAALALSMTLIIFLMYPIMKPIGTDTVVTASTAEKPINTTTNGDTCFQDDELKFEHPKEQTPKGSEKQADELTDQATANYEIYTVKSGDSLWEIAATYYGSGFEFYKIMQLNNIINPNSLEVGQQLKIPN